MTLEELRNQLVAMPKGKYAAIDYAYFAVLFPPGEPDEKARELCYGFAKSVGCRIENKPEAEQLWFVKDA